MRDMTESELESIYDKAMCPACGQNNFEEGPHGGIMQNIKCECGMKLNVVDPEGWEKVWFPRIGQVLEEPAGYVPKYKKSKPKKKFNWFILIQILALIFGIFVGHLIAKDYPEIKKFIGLQFEENK